MFFKRSNSSPSGWTQNNLKNYIFNKAFKKADKIIVNSLEFKKQFKKRFNVDGFGFDSMPGQSDNIVNLVSSAKDSLGLVENIMKLDCFEIIN